MCTLEVVLRQPSCKIFQTIDAGIDSDACLNFCRPIKVGPTVVSVKITMCRPNNAAARPSIGCSSSAVLVCQCVKQRVGLLKAMVSSIEAHVSINGGELATDFEEALMGCCRPSSVSTVN